MWKRQLPLQRINQLLIIFCSNNPHSSNMGFICMPHIKTIGVMTGNSLDAVDVVLTEFGEKSIRDIAFTTLEYPAQMTKDLLKLRALIKEHQAEMDKLGTNSFFVETVNAYSRLVAEAVNKLIADNDLDKKEIAAIGFHGQTCDHFPPSIAGDKEPYTVQISNAGLLADLTGIPVVWDFRSDDIMNGGEGAPLAPVHNLHIAGDMKGKGIFPVAFCNAGNTGNIAVISEDEKGKNIVLGWDIGPFNHFADFLTRTYKGQMCDMDARWGKQGKIIPKLLKKLFDSVAVNDKGDNFYLQLPPKSSDPSWYRVIDELETLKYSFEDTLRTVEYLSTYAYMHSLSFIPENVKMPENFLVFGGGWKNPLCIPDFKDLLSGKGMVLEEHKPLFAKIRNRFSDDCRIEWSDEQGYSGKYMEARIFADLAYCKIIGEPFTYPETTGCLTPTIAGIWRYPGETTKSSLWNRAVKGWTINKNFD